MLGLLERRSDIGGPQGVEAGLLGRLQRWALLAEQPDPFDHPTHDSEVLASRRWVVLEEAPGSPVSSLISHPGIGLGGAAPTFCHSADVWASVIVNPDGDAHPLLFPLSQGAIADPNPGFGGYCRPAEYLDAMALWLAEPDAPRHGRSAYDGAFGRTVSWDRGLSTSLGPELQLRGRHLIGHLGFMGSSCFAFDPATGVAVFAVLSPIVLDVASSRRALGQIVCAATASVTTR